MSRKLVNYSQTPEERKEKYWLCRSMGMGRDWADRMRDWRLSKIERFFGLPVSTYYEPEIDRLLALKDRNGVPY